jgi:hypothetical protein
MLQRLKFFDPFWSKNARSATVSTIFPALEIQRGNVVSEALPLLWTKVKKTLEIGRAHVW